MKLTVEGHLRPSTRNSVMKGNSSMVMSPFEIPPRESIRYLLFGLIFLLHILVLYLTAIVMLP